MYSFSPANLDTKQTAEWEKFLKSKKREKALQEMDNEFVESIAWFQFLQIRWALRCKYTIKMTPTKYAMATKMFGPDLHGIQRYVHQNRHGEHISVNGYGTLGLEQENSHENHKKKKTKKTKTTTEKEPRKIGPYQLYVRKRYHDLADNRTIPTTEKMRIISAEWSSMSQQEKDQWRIQLEAQTNSPPS